MWEVWEAWEAWEFILEVEISPEGEATTRSHVSPCIRPRAFTLIPGLS